MKSTHADASLGSEKRESTSSEDELNDFSFDGSWEIDGLRRRIKNLQAFLILALGLFVGSLYVDVAQLFSKSGFSSRVLATTDIVSAMGKTWVAYDQPIVRVAALSDETCASCQPDEVLAWLRRVIPTLSVQKLDVEKDADGRELVGSGGILSVPAFIFSKDIEQLPVYEQASQLFKKLDDGRYLLDTAQAGIPTGKYLSLPSVGAQDIKSGPDDAPVRVVEFTDFQCPFCKAFHSELQRTLAQYGDKVQYVFKHYPLPIHANAGAAALAGECANEQGKFSEYADMLFAKQGEWEKLKDAPLKFKDYARLLGMNTGSFTTCLESKKYSSRVDANVEEGKKFGISGTPGTFVNGAFLNGAVPTSDLRSAIDAALSEDEQSSVSEQK